MRAFLTTASSRRWLIARLPVRGGVRDRGSRCPATSWRKRSR